MPLKIIDYEKSDFESHHVPSDWIPIFMKIREERIRTNDSLKNKCEGYYTNLILVREMIHFSNFF